MTDVRALVAAQRHDVGAMLTALEPAQWDAPTLCAGWRVREVVAHMTEAFRYPTWRIALELVKARGRFNVMADRNARRDAARLSSAELTAVVVDNADHPWKPIGGGFEGALSHDVIHGLDISVGLGLDHRVPTDRVKVVLDQLTPKRMRFLGADIDGVQLRATDLAWTHGTGPLVEGVAQHLLLVVCGRTLPPGLLSGPGAERFTAAGVG